MFNRRLPQAPSTRLVINGDLCLSCGACVAVCPSNALFLSNIHLTINREICAACKRCLLVCPVQALSHIPTLKTPL